MSELESGKELVERVHLATQTQNTIIVDDGTNEVVIPGYPYRFEARGDKVLVSVDIFKSGYECKTCKGTGKVKVHCACEDTKRPGFKYAEPESPAQELSKCSNCEGNFESKREDIVCPSCEGKTGLLIIPDAGKLLPTTGVIVSMGDLVNPALGLKMHDRVLFGAYVGQMIPTKAPGVVFKAIRDIEIICTIKGGEDMASFDFVVIDKDM